MLPTSLLFIGLLIILFIVYWTIPEKFRPGLMLIASIAFYMSWGVSYIFFLAFSIALSYFAALLLEKISDIKKKKYVFIGTVCLNIASLLILKYTAFIWNTFSNVFSLFSIELSPFAKKLIIPVGISFYTFQTLSYVIDVYKGKIQAERNFSIYALFVSFFPQILSGPINRADKLLPQYKKAHVLTMNKPCWA